MVRVMHYPLMAHIGPDTVWHTSECVEERVLVIPIMLAEVSAAILICLFLPLRRSRSLWTGLGLLLVIWLVTFLFSVPSHDVLIRRFDATVHRRLVVTTGARRTVDGGDDATTMVAG